jgi:hypothetical protein
MNNAGQKIMIAGICRPGSPRRNGVKAGAGLVVGVLATKMPFLTELGCGISNVRFLKQF